VNSNAVTLLGGPHVTFLAEETLRQQPAMDVVMRGKGDLTLRQNTLVWFRLARVRADPRSCWKQILAADVERGWCKQTISGTDIATLGIHPLQSTKGETR